MMRAKPGELKAGWDNQERDMGWAWGDGCRKADANLVGTHLFLYREVTPTETGRTLIEELEARGYDPKTLRFSIRKKQATPKQGKQTG